MLSHLRSKSSRFSCGTVCAAMVRCHGGQTQEADLDLSNMPALLRGSADGEILAAGQPDASPLFVLITAGEMPADRETELTVAEVEQIRQWIE